MSSKPSVQVSCDDDRLWRAVGQFAQWLERNGYSSYDPYDLFGTKYGVLARKWYYRGNPLGIALTVPLILSEIACPRLRTLTVRKNRYATAEAQFILAFLNLHELALDGLRVEDPAPFRSGWID